MNDRFIEALKRLQSQINEKNAQNKEKMYILGEKPNYDPETQELYSWFEDGEVITKKFEVINKEE